MFSAPNYCGEFDNAGGMISVDENLMCSFQVLKPSSRSTRFASPAAMNSTLTGLTGIAGGISSTFGMSSVSTGQTGVVGDNASITNTQAQRQQEAETA